MGFNDSRMVQRAGRRLLSGGEVFLTMARSFVVVALLLSFPATVSAADKIELENAKRVKVQAFPDPYSVLGRGEPLATAEEQPAATTLRPQGPGEEIYPEVAPAIVMVKVADGHGTGFFISPDGWLITNNHVAEGAAYSHDHRGNVARILMGKIGDDGWMQGPDTEVDAIVYKISERQDLALLKIVELPDGVSKVPFLKVAAKLPGPGADVVSIGHPGIGNMWSVRDGQITGTGNFPGDDSEDIAYRMSLSPEQQQLYIDSLKESGRQLRVYQSNLEIHPGDSGGPVCNKKGEVVGVTFAFRGEQTTVTLHIHHDELVSFIKDKPKSPKLLIPNPLFASEGQEVYLDIDSDDQPDASLCKTADESQIISLTVKLPSAASDGAVAGTESEYQWKPHFSMYALPQVTVAFDTDTDGTFDLIFRDQDEDGVPEFCFELDKGDWKVSEQELSAVSEDVYQKDDAKTQFAAWLPNINEILESWKMEQ